MRVLRDNIGFDFCLRFCPLTMLPHQLELLAPARDADIGIEAVNHGADAVYIGGPSFGARTAADNGVTRWRNLDALSAATAGQTVTLSCTGSQTLLASNELNRAGAAKPTCTVTQLP